MEPQPDNVIELELEFEALVHADRTIISWSRADAPLHVRVELDGPDASKIDELVEVPPTLWDQFLDLVLSSILPERSAPALTDEATKPEIKTPAERELPTVGGHEPDAPTPPQRPSAVAFLRCSVSLTLDNGRRTSVLEGPPAMELYARIYGFARETGLPLPG